MGNLGTIRWRRLADGTRVPYLDLRPFGRIYSSRDALGEVPLRTQAEAERLLERIRARVEDGTPLDVVVERLRPDGSSHTEKRAKAWLDAKRRQADAGEITHESVARYEDQVRLYWPSRREGVALSTACPRLRARVARHQNRRRNREPRQMW